MRGGGVASAWGAGSAAGLLVRVEGGAVAGRPPCIQAGICGDLQAPTNSTTNSPTNSHDTAEKRQQVKKRQPEGPEGNEPVIGRCGASS